MMVPMFSIRRIGDLEARRLLAALLFNARGCREWGLA